jgi:hypothetical protein
MMSKLGRFTLCSLLMLALTSGAAFAQDEGSGEGSGEGGEGGGEGAGGEGSGSGEATPPAGGEMGGEMAEGGSMEMHGLTLPKGKVGIAGSTLNINLSKSLVGKPISLAPSVYYGVSDKLTVGLSHDGGTTPMSPSFGAAGAGICVTGTSKGCISAYNTSGIDALFALASGQFSVAAHGGLDILNIKDPPGFFLDVRAGVLGAYNAGKLTVTFDPRVDVGVTKRDVGNKGSLAIPVHVWFAATPKVSPYVGFAFGGPLDHFGDNYGLAAAIGANIMLNEKMGAGVDFTLPALYTKPAGDKAFDARELGLRFMMLL